MEVDGGRWAFSAAKKGGGGGSLPRQYHTVIQYQDIIYIINSRSVAVLRVTPSSQALTSVPYSGILCLAQKRSDNTSQAGEERARSRKIRLQCWHERYGTLPSLAKDIRIAVLYSSIILLNNTWYSGVRSKENLLLRIQSIKNTSQT